MTGVLHARGVFVPVPLREWMFGHSLPSNKHPFFETAARQDVEEVVVDQKSAIMRFTWS